MHEDNNNGTDGTPHEKLDAMDRVANKLIDIMEKYEQAMFPTKRETDEGVIFNEVADLTKPLVSFSITGGIIDIGNSITIERDAFEAVRDHPTNDGHCFLHTKSGHLYELEMTRTAALEILGKTPHKDPKADPDKDIASDDSAVAPAEA